MDHGPMGSRRDGGLYEGTNGCFDSMWRIALFTYLVLESRRERTKHEARIMQRTEPVRVT